jgi:hypothetical protein
MLIKSVYDLIDAFRIFPGNHLFTIGTVKDQHMINPSFLLLLKLTGQFIKFVRVFQVTSLKTFSYCICRNAKTVARPLRRSKAAA